MAFKIFANSVKKKSKDAESYEEIVKNTDIGNPIARLAVVRDKIKKYQEEEKSLVDKLGYRASQVGKDTGRNGKMLKMGNYQFIRMSSVSTAVDEEKLTYLVEKRGFKQPYKKVIKEEYEFNEEAFCKLPFTEEERKQILVEKVSYRHYVKLIEE